MSNHHSLVATEPVGQDSNPVGSRTTIDVSVCIVNWNCRDVLRGCLESLCRLDQGVRLEVIVVDNASSDGAADMVAREFPEVILHRNRVNAGFSRGNNQAAARAHGSYLFFLNNDTVVPAGALGRLVKYLEDHPDVGMVGPRLRDGRGRTQVSYRVQPTMATLLHRTSLLRWTGLLRSSYLQYRRREFDPETKRRVDVLMGAAMLIRREVFFACGRWDEGYTFGGEDMDLSYQVNRRYPVMYLPEVEIIHYGRTSTRQHIDFAATQMAAGLVRYLRNTGCSRPGIWLYKLVIVLDAPVQLVGKGLQTLWRRAFGRGESAEKSLVSFRGAWHFLTRGLGAFWKA